MSARAFVRFLVALILVLGIAGVLTNPKKEDHLSRLKEQIKERVADEIPEAPFLGEMASAVVDLGEGNLEWNNYFLWSTLSQGERRLSVGFLGMVFADEDFGR